MTRSLSLAMERYLFQPRDRIFVKGYGFLSFSRNVDKNVSKNTSKNLSCRYSQKILDHAKQYAVDVLKTASKEQFKK